MNQERVSWFSFNDFAPKGYKIARFLVFFKTPWNIGKQISEAVGERAEYGKNLLKFLAGKLTEEFGKGFSERSLQMMRKFYATFQNTNTLCSELSWSHYRLIMRITNDERRDFYFKECIEANWSVRQLERQINFFL